ncbi:MAG: protein-methionine-sulfoxide reductase catalytic subunit MsrP [Spongiibacteraceae bacterium]|jgi:sulfoxide reductase catalytic subunit YedY|nr:protein-methionine-sulfoxide reductase catalytic subunit MsrP [Spongiibacteraceae bacterium]
MLIHRPPDIQSSEITPETIYLRRRQLLSAALVSAGTWAAGPLLAADENSPQGLAYRPAREDEADAGFFTAEKLTPLQHVTRYNNFFEFGTDKSDPATHAGTLTTTPWSVTIEGEVERPGTYHLEDILAGVDLEERIYRLRCVEAWSMVIPWVGFPLSKLLERVGYNSRARYVAFTTVHRPAEMRGQRSATATLDWPYVEGLRMDEAMHPLTILSVGLYGRTLPNQNGAPIRLVVPWKYGFKSIKSIVRIRLQERRPPTSWNLSAPQEYGFFANVNPEVDHPRWSQMRERRLPSTLLGPRWIATQRFNGYAEQVAHLYNGMNLRRFY